MTRHRLLSLGVLSVLLLSACGKSVTVDQNKIIGKEALTVMMPTGKDVVHPVHGKEVWFAVGAMGGQNKVNANGVAQSHVFEDGATIATVNLNIQPAKKGTHFVAWLQKPGTIERVRLDQLQNPLADVRHVITADVDKDLRAYTEVVVTLEHDGSPSDADTVQAMGKLKEQHR